MKFEKKQHWILRCAMSVALLMVAVARIRGAQPKVEAEVVTLRDGGFVPHQITRPAGPFLLIILNRSHATQFGLTVARSDATVIVPATAVVDFNKHYLLDLPIGTYSVAETTHSGWKPLTIVTH